MRISLVDLSLAGVHVRITIKACKKVSYAGFPLGGPGFLCLSGTLVSAVFIV
jgi:hypothetical protein